MAVCNLKRVISKQFHSKHKQLKKMKSKLWSKILAGSKQSRTMLQPEYILTCKLLKKSIIVARKNYKKDIVTMFKDNQRRLYDYINNQKKARQSV